MIRISITAAVEEPSWPGLCRSSNSRRPASRRSSSWAGRQERTGTTAPTFRRISATADRDRPGTYFTIVEFDSYESAMENSNRPETSEFAAKMAALCDGPPYSAIST